VSGAWKSVVRGYVLVGGVWKFLSYAHRFLITPASTNPDLYYDLSLAPAGFWSNVRSDSGDIRVTAQDGTTQVPREVSGFDYAGHTGSLFIGTSGGTAFYIYYGNPSATEPAANSAYGKYNVWESAAKLVAHLEDVNDSTVNQNNGTSSYPPSFGAGKLKNAGSFNGSNQYISLPKGTGDYNVRGNLGLAASESFALSIWYKGMDTASGGLVPGHGLIGWNNEDVWAGLHLNGGYATYVHYSGGVWKTNIVSSTLVADGNWHLITYVNINNLGYLYIDGQLQINGLSSAFDAPGLYLQPVDISKSYSNVYTSGTMDEARIYNRAPSPTEIATMYANQNDPASFWTTGSEE
jgi:hypothetical protein